MGLSPQEIKLCYQSNPNEEEAIQDGLIKWWETGGDRCTWQVLLDAMKFAGIAQHHCTELVEELHQMMQGEVTFPLIEVLLYTMPVVASCVCVLRTVGVTCVPPLHLCDWSYYVGNKWPTHQTTVMCLFQRVTLVQVITELHNLCVLCDTCA